MLTLIQISNQEENISSLPKAHVANLFVSNNTWQEGSFKASLTNHCLS